MLWEVDLKYALWVLGRAEMYRSETASPIGGALAVPQHYLLSALLFFCFLAPAGVLFPVFSWRRQAQWLRRFRGAGRPLSAYALSQMLWGALAIFLLLCLVLAGLAAAGPALSRAGSGVAAAGGAIRLSPATARLLSGLTPHLSPALLPGLLLTALFLSAFAFLCCNSGHIFSALSLDFVLAGAFLAVSGGIAPAALLPDRINALSPYSPLTWMRELLSALYLSPGGPPPLAPGLKLAASALLLVAVALLYSRRFEKQGRRS